TDDTSRAGRKTFALWQPPELPGRSPLDAAAALRNLDESSLDERTPGHSDSAEGRPEVEELEPVRRPATAEAADLLADLVAAGGRALAFTRSRHAAESVAERTREHLEEVAPGLGSRVAAYRGGYLPEERREVAQSIREGTLRALATTNALELGMDISGLDAVVVAGWPGTRVSLWQQAGRAGRRGADGLVVFVAREDPLDQYVVHHPETIFSTPVEATVFDPGNPYVLAPHLCAAAAELPIRSAELGLFGEHTRELLDVIVARGALRQRPSGWYWTP